MTTTITIHADAIIPKPDGSGALQIHDANGTLVEIVLVGDGMRRDLLTAAAVLYGKILKIKHEEGGGDGKV